MMRAMGASTDADQIAYALRADMFTDAVLTSDIDGDTVRTIIGSAGT